MERNLKDLTVGDLVLMDDRMNGLAVSLSTKSGSIPHKLRVIKRTSGNWPKTGLMVFEGEAHSVSSVNRQSVSVRMPLVSKYNGSEWYCTVRIPFTNMMVNTKN